EARAQEHGSFSIGSSIRVMIGMTTGQRRKIAGAFSAADVLAHVTLILRFKPHEPAVDAAPAKSVDRTVKGFAVCCKAAKKIPIFDCSRESLCRAIQDHQSALVRVKELDVLPEEPNEAAVRAVARVCITRRILRCEIF